MKQIVYLTVCIYLLCHTLSAQRQQSHNVEIIKNPVQKNLRIAQQLVDQNAEDSSLLYLNAILARQFDNSEALLLRAAIYTNGRLFDKALTDYNALLELEPENREATYSRGVIRYVLGQYEYAIEDFDKAVNMHAGETSTAYFKIDPESQMTSGVSTISKMEGDIWNYMGLSYLGLQDYEHALESFNKGIQQVPYMDDLYVNRALTYEALGYTEKAMKDYEYVISRNPANSTAEYNLMNLQGTFVSHTEKLASLNKFIEVNPGNAHGYASRGLYYFDLKSYDLALPDLRQACQLSADNVDYTFNLALCYERLGDLPRAEAGFLEVVELEESNGAAYFNLGNINFREKLYDKAIAFYTLAHFYDDENAAIIYNRALAYFESGMREKACEDMKLVNSIRPALSEKFVMKYCEMEDQ